MPMNLQQLEMLKELVLQPILETIVDKFPKPDDSPNAGGLFWAILNVGSRTSDDKDIQSLPVQNEIINLRKIYMGTIDIFANATLGQEKPSLCDVRIAIFENVIEALHKAYPNYQDSHPKLPVIADDIQGMKKIRELFKQYVTLTQSGSMERFLLALKITYEKEILNLPSFISSNENIIKTNPGYAPGDFSKLDLSYLHFERDKKYSNGNFKGLHLKGSNCEGSTWVNVCLYSANFRKSNLRGVELKNCYESNQIMVGGADVEGMFIHNCTAINFGLMSKTFEELMDFRKNILGMPEIEAAPKLKADSEINASIATIEIVKTTSNDTAIPKTALSDDEGESDVLLQQGNPPIINSRKRPRPEESNDSDSQKSERPAKKLNCWFL